MLARPICSRRSPPWNIIEGSRLSTNPKRCSKVRSGDYKSLRDTSPRFTRFPMCRWPLVLKTTRIARMNDGYSVFRDEKTTAILCSMETDPFSFGDDGSLTNDGAADLRATPDSCTGHQDDPGDMSAGTHLN